MTVAAAVFEPATRVDDVGELLAHALADDLDRAFEQVVRAYQDRIVTAVARALGDPRRAEEVAQDVFVRAYRVLQTYDRPQWIRALSRLRPWLFSIAMNATRNAGVATRRCNDDDPRVRGMGSRGPLADRAPSPAALAERNADWQRVGSAIARLSPKLRDAFVLRYVEEFSYDEIAIALAQPVGTVKANAHRGLIAVRAFLETNE